MKNLLTYLFEYKNFGTIWNIEIHKRNLNHFQYLHIIAKNNLSETRLEI
jgi:hypothetical protein